MTAQIDDGFRWNNKVYNLSRAQNIKSLFDEDDIPKLGFTQSTRVSTGCWRGYVATFGVNNDGRLILWGLRIDDYPADKQIPSLNGNAPSSIEPNGKDRKDLLYTDLDMLLQYSGSILITNGFLQWRYVHMGFQNPMYYETVIELTFHNGCLAETKDFSQEAKRLRSDLRAIKTYKDSDEWIHASYDREYYEKWPLKLHAITPATKEEKELRAKIVLREREIPYLELVASNERLHSRLLELDKTYEFDDKDHKMIIDLLPIYDEFADKNKKEKQSFLFISKYIKKRNLKFSLSTNAKLYQCLAILNNEYIFDERETYLNDYAIEQCRQLSREYPEIFSVDNYK
ncbi:MAG: hypothetical protein Q4F74_04250 [Synergistaceae bacterium]|nr:hypothetical protein [Synergistaceae bacterium]